MTCGRKKSAAAPPPSSAPEFSFPEVTRRTTLPEPTTTTPPTTVAATTAATTTTLPDTIPRPSVIISDNDPPIDADELQAALRQIQRTYFDVIADDPSHLERLHDIYGQALADSLITGLRNRHGHHSA